MLDDETLAGMAAKNIKIVQDQSPDVVRRKGAGAIKVGLPLLMPGGRKRWNSFHEKFTDKPLYKSQPKPGEVELHVDKTLPHREIAEKIRYRLPRNFCPDCNRTDRAHVKGALNMFSLQEPEPGLDIYPGEIVLCCWCQDCQDDDLNAKTKLVIPGMDDPDMDEWRKRMIRQNRMERNIIEYIRAKRMSNDTSIVIRPEELDNFRR